MAEHITAFVAQQIPELPTLETMQAGAARLFPRLPVRIEALPSQTEEAGRRLVSVNGIPVVVLEVSAAIPEPNWMDAATEAIQWPGAVQALAEHRAHLVVASVGILQGHQDALAASLAVSILAAVLCSSAAPTAVVWDSAGTVTEPIAFIKATQALLEGGRLEAIPSDIWVRLRFTRGNEPEAIGAVTTGLLPFVGREVELVPTQMPVAEVARRVLGIVNYLIRQGPVIADGETLETTPGERIRAHHRLRGRNPGTAVLELSLEQPAEVV